MLAGRDADHISLVSAAPGWGLAFREFLYLYVLTDFTKTLEKCVIQHIINKLLFISYFINKLSSFRWSGHDHMGKSASQKILLFTRVS